MMKTAPPILEIEGLSVTYHNSCCCLHAVEEVSFRVAPGEFVALVGASGSGKTTLIRGLLGLLRNYAVTRVKEIRFAGAEIAPAELYRHLGRKIGFIPQNPLGALNPVRPVGAQMSEVFRFHLGVSAGEARERSRAVLARLQMSDANRVMAAYPHELSGGMAQRVVLGMALAMEPILLIADEPTSSLDANLRAELLAQIRLLCGQGMGVLFITHDLKLVAAYADSALVMREGRIVKPGAGATHSLTSGADLWERENLLGYGLSA